MSSIVHLHRHSEFSLLDGTGTAKQYAERAVELGQPALALTDHGTLAGALSHHKACNEAGILPIMGIEAYFKPNRHLKDTENKEYFHLVLHAKNLEGWKNLMRISSEAYSSGFYYKPCLDWELLELYGRDLICSTACVSSYMNRAFIRGDDDGVYKTIHRLKEIFRDDLFVEVMPHDFDNQRLLNIHLINLANEESLPVIATVDAHFPYADWADTQDILIMMSTGQSFEKRKIKKEETGEDTYLTGCPTAYLMDRQEVADTFEKYHPDIPSEVIRDAMNNTHLVASRVEPLQLSKATKMPKVDVDPEATVKQWCVEGMERIEKTDDVAYWDRLEYEFGVLKSNAVLDYFVIVGDLVRWAIEAGIRVGAGRGSAAGSLVSYLIGITQLDPIAHGLLFERFLNPDRKGMPDIDLDFQADRRDEVKAYAASKYGEAHVADICALQTFKPRACIQKVGRVFDLHKETYAATDQIDPLEKRPLDRVAQVDSLVGEFKATYPDVWHHAVRLQDQVHTQSKHAGGVVITDLPLSDYIPTMLGKKGETLTQWDGRTLDDYGLMKIDFLGIQGLAMQEYACDLIEKSGHERPKLNELPPLRNPRQCDQRVLDVFNRGLVLGVFQFTGSSGFARLIRKIGADWIGDLGAANAIYRPGPLGSGVDVSYADRKREREPVSYPHSTAEEALSETYGLIVYQEQIMELAKKMAGFSGGQADDLRKAISKEYRLGLEHVKQWLKDKGYADMWIDGCRSNHINDTIISTVWESILAFGEYGFNKSHAYAYAVQSYQDAWLKAYFPSEFYASLLTFDPDLAMAAVRESRAFDVQIKGPDINQSSFGFTIDGDSILFGLNGVKYLGDKGIKTVLEGQPYRSVEDFLERIPARACNKRAQSSLKNAGAFDSLGLRKTWTDDRKAEAEREALGVSLSQGNTLRKYRKMISDMSTSQLLFEVLDNRSGVVIGGEITDTRVIKTRNNKKMAFVTVQMVGEGEFNCTMFPDTYNDFFDLAEIGKPVMIRGRKDIRPNGEATVIIDSMVGVEELALEMGNNDRGQD